MSSNQIHIYESTDNKRKKGFGLFSEMFGDLWESKELAKRLFIRDKKAEYRQSLLGVLWAFITPLTNALVWIFLSASGAVNVEGTGIPYPLFVFIGTILWSVFSESLSMPLMQTTSSKALISKINFPKEAILISGFYKVLFNTIIKMVIIVLALLAFQIQINANILYFLALVVFLICFGICFGLALAPIGMLYKDIERALPIALTLFMYLTPVVYKESKIKSLQGLLDINPLTPMINSARNLATGGSFENPQYLLAICIFSLVIGFIGWIFYRVSIPIIVERM